MAAESHVTTGQLTVLANFIQANIVGTFNLLQSSKKYSGSSTGDDKPNFRTFHDIPWNEVYDSLSAGDAPFSETAPYVCARPQRSADHLVELVRHLRASRFDHHLAPKTMYLSDSWKTGSGGDPESGKRTVHMPSYLETGKNFRDWLFVGDDVEALLTVLETVKPGETINFGGNNGSNHLPNL